MIRAEALEALLDYHRPACTAHGGTLTQPEDAVTQAFLLGRKTHPDPGHTELSCSTAPAMFCGCDLNVFQDGIQHSLVVPGRWSPTTTFA